MPVQHVDGSTAFHGCLPTPCVARHVVVPLFLSPNNRNHLAVLTLAMTGKYVLPRAALSVLVSNYPLTGNIRGETCASRRCCKYDHTVSAQCGFDLLKRTR